MNTKMAGLLAGALLAMMALAPLGVAHDDVAGNNRVFGNYVGAAGPWIRIDDQDIFAGNALCDLELLSDGDVATTGDNFLDEPLADGTATGGTTQAENDWGDGGQGAACHTPNTHYTTAGFNTQECNYAPATAKDDNSAVVWISTGCDWITNVPDPSDPSIVQLVVNAAGCAVNAVLSGTGNPVGAVDEIVFVCVDRLIDCTIGIGSLDPSDTCPAGAGGQACGPDGTIDGSNSGNGNTVTGVPYPTTYPYAPTPTTTGNCSSTHGVASVFVWEAVVVDPLQVNYYYATTGTIS